MIITSKFERGPALDVFSEKDIKKEPMLFRATYDFAVACGGPLTHNFLLTLNDIWQDNIVIDSRVHMLMPGMWPCIPGWHHDDVPRTRADKQPNYVEQDYVSEHAMALFGDCSLTEFAEGSAEFEIPPIGQKIYKTWDPIVEQYCNEGKLTRHRINPNEITIFNSHTWHRGMPTTHRGFRFFIRATRFSKIKPENEIRYNANVYMPVIEEGW